MSIVFNADEVFAMAERVEANGAAFYRRAAQQHPDKKDSDFLLEMAAMEDEHQRIFAQMRRDLAGKEKELTAYDPYEEATLYLGALADSHGGEGAPSIADKLTGKETVLEIIRTAIDLEKKSVLFYIGIRDLVPQKFGKAKVERIIREEKSHIVTLSQQLKARQPH